MSMRNIPRASISRRALLAIPLLPGYSLRSATDQTSGFERETIGQAVPDRALAPPLTLGLARVVLHSGAGTWAATPGGVRILVVESGGLEVAAVGRGNAAITPADFAGAPAPPRSNDALFLPAGTAMPFAAIGVVSLRNPGSRAAVILDAAVYPEEPRPLARAFTTNEGVSFQLLANASATVAPGGRAMVTLERLWLGPGAELPLEARTGLRIMYLEAGTVDLRPHAGEVYAARAAASAPYAMPGSLQPLRDNERRDVTAGGVIYLTMGTEAKISNVSARPAAMLALAVRDDGRANVARNMNAEMER